MKQKIIQLLLVLLVSTTAQASMTYEFVVSEYAVIDESRRMVGGLHGVSEDASRHFLSMLMCGTGNDSFVDIERVAVVSISDELCKSVYEDMYRLRFVELVDFAFYGRLPVYEMLIDDGAVVSIKKTIKTAKRTE